MNQWDKNRSNQMFKNKITAAKSTLTKSTHKTYYLVFTTTNFKGKTKATQKQNYQKFKSGNPIDNEVLPMIALKPILQNQILRNILKEFNLQQYSKVIYD